MADLLLKDVTEDRVRAFLEDARGDNEDAPEVTDDDVENVLTTARARKSLIDSRPVEERMELREQPFLSSHDDGEPEGEGVEVIDGGNV
jgi:hypothetical protein